MSQLSNCLKMITMLRGRGVVNAKEIAEVLEVKERMVRKYKQDIEMAGIPIATKPGRYGGYYLEREAMLPEIDFQKEELIGLRAAYEMISRKESFPHKTGFGMAYNRVQALTKQKEEIEKTMYYIKRSKPNPLFTLGKEMILKIHGAIVTRQKIKIVYGKRNGKLSDRIIHPYALIQYNDGWYVRAYCQLREEERTFKFVRMKEVTILAEKFENVPFQIDENKLGICDDAYEIKLHISPPYAITVPESIWGENQLIMKESNGDIRFQARMYGKESIVKWILGMGSYVQVIEPLEIKERIVMELKQAIESY